MIASLLALAMLAPSPYPTTPTPMPVYIIRENNVVVGWSTDGVQGKLEVVLHCPQPQSVDICWSGNTKNFRVQKNMEDS